MIAKRVCFIFVVGIFLVIGEISAAEEKSKKLEVVKPLSRSAPTPSVFKIPKLPPEVPRVVRHSDPSIVEIQKQLEDIVKIQQTLQLKRDQQIIEIQRIVEQARAHQKLLDGLAKVRESARETRPNQIEEALRRQKIRLIEEQAVKNQAVLEKFKEEKASKGKSEKEKSKKEKDEKKPKKK